MGWARSRGREGRGRSGRVRRGKKKEEESDGGRRPLWEIFTRHECN